MTEEYLEYLHQCLNNANVLKSNDGSPYLYMAENMWKVFRDCGFTEFSDEDIEKAKTPDCPTIVIKGVGRVRMMIPTYGTDLTF